MRVNADHICQHWNRYGVKYKYMNIDKLKNKHIEYWVFCGMIKCFIENSAGQLCRVLQSHAQSERVKQIYTDTLRVIKSHTDLYRHIESHIESELHKLWQETRRMLIEQCGFWSGCHNFFHFLSAPIQISIFPVRPR